MPPRFFTLSQANATLPLVRRIVADITALYPDWADLVHRYELVAAPARPEKGESAEQVELRERIEDVARRINGFLRELEQVGCVFKGFNEGLVDFHGQLDGRDILWCWKQGEDEIRHWHEVEAGFAGRQPIPEMVRGA
ncbi:MAG: DUF2203 domain-containing protein [Gemmatimonadales bacterium]